MKMNILYAIGAMTILVACSAPYQAQKAVWTVKEVQESYNKDSAKKYNTNCILYRGTDNQSHYFLSQFTDKWVFLSIKKTELSLTEEKPYKVDSTVKLGYYYVDPNNHFVKTRDFN